MAKLVDCFSMEFTGNNMKVLCEPPITETFEVKSKPSHRTSTPTQKREPSSINKPNIKCDRCGYSHARNSCPAFGKQCAACKKFNHFAQKCNAPKNNTKNAEELCFESLELDTFKMDVLNVHSCDYNITSTKDEWLTEIMVNNKVLTFKLDCGSQVNTISQKLINQLNPVPSLRTTNVTLECFGGFLLQPIGSVLLTLQKGNKALNTQFIVVSDHRKPLLGLRSCVDLGLIKRIENVTEVNNVDKFVSENFDVFDGLGCFPEVLKLKLSNEAIPRANPARRVPLKIKDKLKVSLNNLVKENIIAPVNEPCEWVNNLVIVEKPDSSLRLCIDPQQLNKYLVRDYYEIPTLEELSLKLANKSYYCLFDLKCGFHQLNLDTPNQVNLVALAHHLVFLDI